MNRERAFVLALELYKIAPEYRYSIYELADDILDYILNGVKPSEEREEPVENWVDILRKELIDKITEKEQSPIYTRILENNGKPSQWKEFFENQAANSIVYNDTIPACENPNNFHNPTVKKEVPSWDKSCLHKF